VPAACARALATTYPTAVGALQDAHGEAIVASLVDTLAWVVRGAGAALRGPPPLRTGAAEQFLVDTTPEAIGYQMASRLEEHGLRVLPAPSASAGGSSARAPPREDSHAAGSSHWGGGYTHPSSPGQVASGGGSQWGEGYASAGAGPSRAPRSTWGPSASGPRAAHEYPFDPAPRAHYSGYARGDTPPPPDMAP